MRQLQTGLTAYFDFYNYENHIKVSTIEHQLNGIMRSDRRLSYPAGCNFFFSSVVHAYGTHHSLALRNIHASLTVVTVMLVSCGVMGAFARPAVVTAIH